MAYSDNIGCTQEPAELSSVAVFALDVVTQAEIADKDDVVNNTLISGKKENACILVALTAGGYDIYVAQGSATTDKWSRVSGEADVTPA